MEKLPSNIYSKIYPTGSAPCKFYGTAKIHKLLPNDTINGLLLRPIVSNIGTATYHLSKYLAELFSPLSESKNTIKNTKYFPEKIKKEHDNDGDDDDELLLWYGSPTKGV